MYTERKINVPIFFPRLFYNTIASVPAVTEFVRLYCVWFYFVNEAHGSSNRTEVRRQRPSTKRTAVSSTYYYYYIYSPRQPYNSFLLFSHGLYLNTTSFIFESINLGICDFYNSSFFRTKYNTLYLKGSFYTHIFCEYNN